MRIERQNELWAMLPETLQAELRRIYLKKNLDSFTDGYKGALRDLFGVPNLIDQTEEKQKEPRFKVGDVMYVVDPEHPLYNQRVRLDRWIVDSGFWLVEDRNCNLRDIEECDLSYTEPKVEEDKNSVSSRQNCSNSTENGILDSKIQSESAESVETGKNSQSANHISDTTKMVDYAQYRLDLTKEIAVAVIKSDRWDFSSCNPVEQANEIVKRLKETEE